MQILEEFHHSDWHVSFTKEEQLTAISVLEAGSILRFQSMPFLLEPHEQRFLSNDFSGIKSKNISFNPTTDALRGIECSAVESQQLKMMLQRFSRYAADLITHLFPTYQSALIQGRTSFRPVEIAGRVTSYRKDDTRLHVDAFPATPNQGKRILRVFSNINPDGKARIWRTGESFENVAQRFLPLVAKNWFGKSALLKTLKITKSYRTDYDHIMLNIHDNMKADMDYQKNVTQAEIAFLPGNTWIVQTDHVSHAAMSGQHMLEQTFYLPVSAMREPGLSPLRVLEKMTGKELV